MLQKLRAIFGKFFRGADRYDRIRTFESLYVGFHDPRTGGKGEGEGLDISIESVRFASFTKLPKETELELSLRFCYEFTETRTVNVKARVLKCYKLRNQRRHRTVCEFTEVKSSDVKEIENLVTWLAKAKEKYAGFRYGKIRE